MYIGGFSTAATICIVVEICLVYISLKIAPRIIEKDKYVSNIPDNNSTCYHIFIHRDCAVDLHSSNIQSIESLPVEVKFAHEFLAKLDTAAGISKRVQRRRPCANSHDIWNYYQEASRYTGFRRYTDLECNINMHVILIFIAWRKGKINFLYWIKINTKM